MPQWAGSCWYYLRFTDPHNEQQAWSEEAERSWLPVDLYVGGAEHAVLHLLYARFWHRFLHDEGVLAHPEPYGKLFHQGLILGEDGNKMSKSVGNVVSPDVVIEAYGADSLRLFEMFLGPLEAVKPWSEKGIEGVHRFLRKVNRECLRKDKHLSGEEYFTEWLPKNPDSEVLFGKCMSEASSTQIPLIIKSYHWPSEGTIADIGW